MAKETVESLSELQKAEAVDCILPGILVFLDKFLAKEQISDELESLRRSYVDLLQCVSYESREEVRKNIAALTELFPFKHETSVKSGKFGRIREKRLINIRQFHFKQNQRKSERKNKMHCNDDNRLVTNINDESRLIPKSGKNPRAMTDTEDENQVGQVNLGTDDESQLVSGTDDESRYVTITDGERRVSVGGESFVELSRSQNDLTSPKYAKLADVNINEGHLFHKENDGLRQRWFLLEESVLKCYKRRNQGLLFEVNFSDGNFSAIQGRIGKMFAIRLSATKANSSHLFASPKADIVASWLMALSRAGVRLQDDILREVSMNQQNNNKVKWSLDGENSPEKDEFRSDLLEALEFIERSRSPCILPKRSSYSFKELDVLKKLKSSIAAKKAECKLNRRKTWSAGTLPITNLAMLERFRKPISGSDGNDITAKKDDAIAKELASKSLPEILTSSGVIPITKEDRDELEASMDNADQFDGSEEELPCCVKSMPEGLNKPSGPSVRSSQSSQRSITAQSVPDLLIHPSQETLCQSPSPKIEPRQLKPSISLTRVMSMKASLMKNAIISGWRRKGRRGSGLTAFDQELSDIQGCLFRKKGVQWKQRWCGVTEDTFYAFRDSQYKQEDFRCSLRKCYVVPSFQEPGRGYSFKLVRRKGEEIVLAAEDTNEVERWITVLQRETSKYHLSEGTHDSRSSSLTVSLFGSDTVGDSSAAEDTPSETGNAYCETTDKDSSDEQSTTCNISTKIKSRGLHEKGFVYYLVKQGTWEHCWMEVSFGVLSIYNNEMKDTVLQRDHVALCDIQPDSANAQRSYSFVLKKASRHPVYFCVESELEFCKWQKCFNSWTKRNNEEKTESRGDTTGHPAVKNGNVIIPRDNYLVLPRSSPVGETPVTSDSDCCGDGTDSKNSDLEQPKVRRSTTDVLSQITPKLKRRSQSSVDTLETNNDDEKNAVKSSFLYYKDSSGLWVKYWCVLDSAVINCFTSPEDGVASFSVKINGCEIRRTSCKCKDYTFDVFNRRLDKHHEFAGESTYVMYAWMKVLKISAGLGAVKDFSDEVTVSNSEELGNEAKDSKNTENNLDDEMFENNDSNCDVPVNLSENIAITRTSFSAPTSPKRKPKITSLDEVLKLLREKRLEQELLTKKHSTSERARLKWQHSMLVVLRKTRSMRTHSSTENLKSSGSIGLDSANNISPEWNEKAAKLKYHEISAKYDSILEDERQKMLRRETLLKKRRNSLTLRKDILQKKLGRIQDGGKGTIKKRQSKSDAKEMAASFSKGGNEEAKKQLVDINAELEGIKRDIESNHEQQRRISQDLSEQKRKELHELRISVDMSPQVSKTNLHEGKSLRRRQASDSSLSESYRKMMVKNDPFKFPLTHTMSTPIGDLRPKSFSSVHVPKVKSSPLLRRKTYDNTDGLKTPKVKSRASQEAMSLALSQIEDFEAFLQDSFRSCGADVDC